MTATEKKVRKFAGVDGHLNPALFIGDPTNGDQLVIGYTYEQLESHPIPETADGHEFNSVGHFLGTLDFGCYDSPEDLHLHRLS